MLLQQRPLALLSLQEIGRHGHLSTRNVDAILLADASEGEVADRGKRSKVDLTFPVNRLLLLGPVRGCVSP